MHEFARRHREKVVQLRANPRHGTGYVLACCLGAANRLIRWSYQGREAEATAERFPACRWCERLGDSVIALQAGRGVRIVTAEQSALRFLASRPSTGYDGAKGGTTMHISVLVERIAGNGYRARGADPFAITVKAATREGALAKLREKIDARLQRGAELVSLEVGPEANPGVKFAGMFKGDPLLGDWKQAMADYRKEVDADPDYP
jgi:hypothetical protein